MKNLTYIARTLRIGMPALALAIALPGCASLPTDLVSSGTLTVERIHSRQARIGRVQARQEADELVVYGELHRRLPGQTRIPGHLHIKVSGRDGTTLAETTGKYRRQSVKSRLAKFWVTLPVKPGDAAAVSVEHHDYSHGNG